MDYKISTYDTTVSVWEERVNEPDFARRVFHPAIGFMKKRGWKITACPETQKRYRCLSKHTRIGAKGDLHVKLRLCGRHIEVVIWQELHNVSNPNGGQYDFDKRQRMPYLLGLRCDLEMKRLIAFLEGKTGYAVENRNPIRGNADRAIHQHIISSGHYRPELGHAPFSMESNRSSADDGVLAHNRIVWFYDDKGRLSRGRAFYNLNNMWWVRLSHDTYTNKASFDLYVRCPEAPRQKKNEELRRAVLERKISEAVRSMDFIRAQKFKELLFGKEPLFRIWAKDHQAFYRASACGYTTDPISAGLYTREEAIRHVSRSADLQMIPATKEAA